MIGHLEVGSVVVHSASDGTLMTVTDGDETCVKCNWIDDDQSLREQWHLPEKLLVVFE